MKIAICSLKFLAKCAFLKITFPHFKLDILILSWSDFVSDVNDTSNDFCWQFDYSKVFNIATAVHWPLSLAHVQNKSFQPLFSLSCFFFSSSWDRFEHLSAFCLIEELHFRWCSSFWQRVQHFLFLIYTTRFT